MSMYVHIKSNSRVTLQRFNNVPTSHQRLTNKKPGFRNRLLLLELSSSEVPKMSTHYRLLPVLLLQLHFRTGKEDLFAEDITYLSQRTRKRMGKEQGSMR